MASSEEPHKSIPTDDKTMAQVFRIADSISFPMTMQAAVELGLFEIIGNGQLTSTEVAAKLPVKENPQAPEMVNRILRHLAAHSVVSCSAKSTSNIGDKMWVYGLTPVARCFVKDEDGLSMAPLLMLLNDKVFFDSWHKLKDVVLEGGTAFDKAHGMSAFEYASTDQRFNDVFNAGMFNHTTIFMKKLLQHYEGFSGINQLLDVGGGVGHNLRIILSEYPSIKGINFDLPHVIKNGIHHPGIEHVKGNMFEGIPTTDAIFMKWILHAWDDELCVQLLKNCHKAIPGNGKIIVVESILSERPDETTNAEKVNRGIDMAMMAQSPGGKERTEREFSALATSAGFKGIRFECYVYNLWVMELYK